MPVATLLMLGSIGADVKEIQSRLSAQGFDPGPIDGIFGPRTDTAVRRFQAARGLVEDGIVGPQTLIALDERGQDNNGPSLLVRLGRIAENQFGLQVTECNAPGAPAHWGPVTPGVHSANSHHNRGEAFDAGGPLAQQEAFTDWVAANYGSQLAELIHNPNGSIDTGQPVPPEFWGLDTWQAHRRHVHVAASS